MIQVARSARGDGDGDGVHGTGNSTKRSEAEKPPAELLRTSYFFVRLLYFL
jgi:hypothetical protein